jgi:hypothetical protein
MKQAANPVGCLYAHSDAYPKYEWALHRQFDTALLDSSDTKRDFVKHYGSFLKKDYFQTTLMIYDTAILEPDTVSRLFELNEKYPIAVRMDQGILNLYFNCERSLWKQIPVSDAKGFLYDYLERENCKTKDYLILKVAHGT